jgi:molybdopterin molybdotransferase/putative molybdopterin biosynthesis protein
LEKKRNGPGKLPTRGEVMAKFFAKWQAPAKVEAVGTAQAYGRVLAEDVVALVDKPVYRASRMDGVAVKSAAFKDGIPDATGWVHGKDWTRADTGDDFPDEYDAVFAIEKVEVLPGGGLKFDPEVELPVEPGYGVSSQGSMFKKGTLVGKKGTTLNACDISAIAMGAVDTVSVYVKPKVAFIPTGSELVPLGTIPGRGQSVDSNSLMADAMLREMGAEPLIYPIVKDNRAELEKLLDDALAKADVVVFSAGTSKGEEDYCHVLLENRGELFCHGVSSAPGRPLSLALVDGKPVVNVAGPPVGCFNGLDWCVHPIVSAYLGVKPTPRHTVKAKLGEPIVMRGGSFELYIRLDLEKTDDGYVAHPIALGERPATDGLRARGLYITRLQPEPTGAGDVIEVELI